MRGKNGNLVKRGHDRSLYLGPGGLFIQLSFNILVVYVFPTALFLVNANMCALESTCTDCPYVIWSHKCTTCLFPASEEKLINGFFIARERNDSKKVTLPHFFLFICCCCRALCQSTLLKATATRTLGQDGWEGDNVFRLGLHLVLGESVAIDGRQAVLLSVLFSIYGRLRAPSPAHACLSQNAQLLRGCLFGVVGGTVECKCKDPVFIPTLSFTGFVSFIQWFHFANISFSGKCSRVTSQLPHYLLVPSLECDLLKETTFLSPCIGQALKETSVEENSLSSLGRCAL